MIKGQFFVISAVIASLIIGILSANITEASNQNYEVEEFSNQVSQIKIEIKKITRDGKVTNKEKENFNKMLQSYEDFQTDIEVDNSKPCIKVHLKSSTKDIKMPCIS